MDYMTKKGAEELLYRIKLHWAMQGKKINGYVAARSSAGPDKEQTYIVRTDMINGLPRQNLVDVEDRPMQ